MSVPTLRSAAPVNLRPERWTPDWTQILVNAVAKPGVVAKAYSQFWSYSVGNQLLAWFQCIQRGIEPGPIHTFMGWKELGRYVKKGEKALTLCMPVTIKRRRNDDRDRDGAAETTAAGDGAERINEAASFTRFVYRPNWFVLSQTEGKEYVPAELPEWQEGLALETLNIQRIRFAHPDGNTQGYAAERQVAVSPIAFMPHRTLFHELAHVVLGHTEELRRMDDGNEPTPRDLREVEAECVALICCQSLKLGGEEFSRGYIQHWLKGETIPERSAQRIFKAADQVLRAGRQGGADGCAE